MTETELLDVLYDVGAVLSDERQLPDDERVNSALHAAINGFLDRSGRDTRDGVHEAYGRTILAKLLAMPPLEDFRVD